MEVAWISLGSPLRVVMNESTISSKGRLNSRSIYCALLRDLLGDWGNYLSVDRCELLRHWVSTAVRTPMKHVAKHFCFNMNTVQQMLPSDPPLADSTSASQIIQKKQRKRTESELFSTQSFLQTLIKPCYVSRLSAPVATQAPSTHATQSAQT